MITYFEHSPVHKTHTYIHTAYGTTYILREQGKVAF